jgi:hypothetical protein
MFVRRSFGLLSLLALSSCGKGTKDEETGVDSTPVDTGDVDSGEEAKEGTPLIVELDADALDGQSTFALTWVDLNSLDSSEVLFAAKNTHGSIVERQQEFLLRDPLEEELQVVDADSGLAVATYVGSIQREDSGITTYFGLAEQWVVFSNMEMVSLGINEGWNFYSPVTKTFTTFSNLPMSSNLSPVDVLSISGTFTSDSFSKERMVMIPWAMMNVTTSIETVWDSQLPSMWNCVLDERPPEDHFFSATEKNVWIAGEVPYSYMDSDGNGEYDPTDSLLSKTCSGEHPVMATFIAEPTTLGQAVHFSTVEIKPGWSLIRLFEDGKEESITFVDMEDYKSLHISTTCEHSELEPEPSSL